MEVKTNFKSKKGITLIALVITIIVLLILAGVSIAMLTGENGILNQARKSDDETRAAAVQEAIDLWKTNKVLDEKTNSSTAGLDTELLDSLEEQKLLTETEREELETTGLTTIGDRVIEFNVATELGDVYTDDMIGQKITYSANGQSEWIVFGKDGAGNILITTKAPVANGFNLQGGVERWLNYEEELNAACSGYATQIQEREDITARSITMDDINYVTGFEKPDLSSYRYTFATTPNEENRIINYYYPSLSASSTGYWQAPSDENPWTPGEELDPYFYLYSGGQFIYVGPDNDFVGVQLESGKINEENYKYVVGDGYKEGTFFDPYVVASRSVGVDSSGAGFHIAGVYEGGVFSNLSNLCNSDAGGR